MSILQEMLRDLPMSVSDLGMLVRTAPHRYKIYSIPKRSGKGSRVIAQPAAEVKILQRWLVDRVLVNYPIHDAAVAYRHGVGIKDNAAKHSKNRFLLKMDFCDFFPSITVTDFVLHTHKYAPQYVQDLPVLNNVLFRAPKGTGDRILSIGAPSSPALSNSIAYDLDVEISEVVKQKNVTYTRYADDLVFSTDVPNVLKDVLVEVRLLCKKIAYPRLQLNNDKTIFASKKVNRTVTGLILSNEGRVSIGWRNKRVLRNAIHRFEKGQLEESRAQWVRGYLSYIRDVEPELFFKLRSKSGERSRKALFGG